MVMRDIQVLPFLVSELRLPPDEQATLGRQWWPSYAHAVVAAVLVALCFVTASVAVGVRDLINGRRARH